MFICLPEEDLFGPADDEDEDDSPFGRGGGLFSTKSSGLFDDDDEDEGVRLFWLIYEGLRAFFCAKCTMGLFHDDGDEGL